MSDARVLGAGLLAGGLFGVGLGVSGMTRADNIINFLDIRDRWDPTLGLVMLGAIAAHGLTRWWILRREAPALVPTFSLPAKTGIDRQLVVGAALFGIGWALAGYCPGPALVSLPSGDWAPVLFVTSMLLGMAIHDRAAAM